MLLEYSEFDCIVNFTIVFYIFLCFMLLISVHFTLKYSFQHFLKGRCNGDGLPQLLLVWESLYLPSTFEWQLCWVRNPLIPYAEDSLVTHMFFCLLTKDFLFVFNFWQLIFDIICLERISSWFFGGNLWALWTWISKSFPRFGMFSVITS